MGEDCALTPDIELEAFGARVPIGEIPAHEGWDEFIFRHPYRAREKRAATVGANGDRGMLRRTAAVSAVPATNPDHPTVFCDIFLDREALAQFGSRLDGGFDENHVERGPPWTIARGDAVNHEIAAHDTELPGVEGYCGRGRAAGGDHAVEQTPVTQATRAVPVDEVAMRDFAGKPRPIRQQHLIALASKQHGRGRARASRADYDDVVLPFHDRLLRRDGTDSLNRVLRREGFGQPQVWRKAPQSCILDACSTGMT